MFKPRHLGSTVKFIVILYLDISIFLGMWCMYAINKFYYRIIDSKATQSRDNKKS